MQPLIKTFNKCQLYSIIAKAYDLHSQLQAIEYEQNNFIHADYSFDEEVIDRVGKLSEINECIDCFNVKYKKEAAADSYENGFEYHVNLEVDKQKKQPLAGVVPIIMRSLENIESTLKETFGVAGLEKEFTNRNAIVLNKFAEYMATIPEDLSAHAIIYYGAGHMPFFEEQLCKKYNLTLEAEEWITAIVTDI